MRLDEEAEHPSHVHYTFPAVFQQVKVFLRNHRQRVRWEKFSDVYYDIGHFVNYEESKIVSSYIKGSFIQGFFKKTRGMIIIYS